MATMNVNAEPVRHTPPARCKLTPRQARWACEHDWFVMYDEDYATLVVNDCVDGKWVETSFDGTFADLRDWAGY